MTQSMPRLWAPWRMEYILGNKKKKNGKKPKCPFCELPKKGVNKDTLIFFQNARLLVIMNRYPYNPGHLMVIPRAHIENPCDLPPAVWAEMNQAVKLCLKILGKATGAKAFNLGMNVGAAAGAGIGAHLHWHVLPRWGGDTNFMPLLAETKCLPAHNLTVYRQLAPYFRDFSAQLAKAKI